MRYPASEKLEIIRSNNPSAGGPDVAKARHPALDIAFGVNAAKRGPEAQCSEGRKGCAARWAGYQSYRGALRLAQHPF